MEWKYRFLSDFTDDILTQTYNDLSPSRKAYIDSFSHSLSKRRSLAGERLVKELLEESFCIMNPIILRDPKGKPYINNKKIHISIAHSENLIVCAADFSPLGIDAERIKPISPSLIDRVCTPEEKQFVLENENINLEHFFRIWTGKEAFFKKQGTGITDFKAVNVLKLNSTIFHIDDYLIQII